MSNSRSSLNALNSSFGSVSDTLSTSTKVYKTFKIILKLAESIQLTCVFL